MNQDEYDQELAILITRLGDEMAAGKSHQLEEVCQQHPEFATDIRDLWGTIVVTQAIGFAKSLGENSPDSDSVYSTLELPFDMGNYILTEEIGRGGMGIVYRATRKSDGQDVAIKMIIKGEFASEVDQQRFEAEARAAASLDHPNIVPIYEIGDFQGRAYFCMKLIEGQTLGQILQTGPINSNRAARILSQISYAIDFAHREGVLHRDLKPSNILVDQQDVAYIADFGLAKFDHGQNSLTKSGAILGTPTYMAPEQAAGQRGQVNALSDVYSLGAILYHMVSGRPPFLAATPVDTVLLVLEQDPIAPRVLNARVNRDLEMIAMRCLQKPQDLRYSAASGLADDLRAFLNNKPISARDGRFAQVVANLFRDTHHAAVLENWGLLWMWHSLVLLLACFATNFIYLANDKHVAPFLYWTVWLAGFGTWAVVFWVLRRRMGPVTFVERQIAHIWAACMLCVGALHPIGTILDLDDFTLAPVIAVFGAMVFLVKAGILSGVFYICAAAMLVTAFVMTGFVDYSMFIFGVVSAACFFFSGLKYYRIRKFNENSVALR